MQRFYSTPLFASENSFLEIGSQNHIGFSLVTAFLRELSLGLSFSFAVKNFIEALLTNSAVLKNVRITWGINACLLKAKYDTARDLPLEIFSAVYVLTFLLPPDFYSVMLGISLVHYTFMRSCSDFCTLIRYLCQHQFLCARDQIFVPSLSGFHLFKVQQTAITKHELCN